MGVSKIEREIIYAILKLEKRNSPGASFQRNRSINLEKNAAELIRPDNTIVPPPKGEQGKQRG